MAQNQIITELVFKVSEGKIKTTTKEVKKNIQEIREEAGKLNVVDRAFVKMTSNGKKLNASIKAVNKEFAAMRKVTSKIAMSFLTVGLSALFLGMAIKNFAIKNLRSLFNTFAQVTEGTSEYAQSIGRVAAAFEFLKYSIVSAFTSTEFGLAILETLANILDHISGLFQKYPTLGIGTIVGLVGLAILGTALVVLGQLSTAISSIAKAFGDFSKGNTLLKFFSFFSKGTLVTKLNTLGTSFGTLGTKIKSVLLAPLRLVQWSFGKLIPLLGGVIAFIPKLIGFGGAVEKVAGPASKTVGLLGRFFYWISLIQIAIELVKGVLAGFASSFNFVTENLGGTNNAMDGLISLGKLLLGILDVLFKAITLVARGFGFLVGAIVGGALGAISSLIGYFRGAINEANKFINMLKRLVKWLKKLFTWRKKTGTGGNGGSSGGGGGTQMATGGIVTSPTRALIGEAGPEAVIPLNRAGLTGGIDMGGVNVTVNVSNTNASPAMIGNSVVSALQRELRRKGVSAGL